MVVETHTGLREQPTRAMSRPEQTWAAPGRFSLKRFLYYSTHLLTRWRGPWSWWWLGQGSWWRLVKFLSILTLRNWYLTWPSESILLFLQNSIWIWPRALFATSIYELVVAALKKSKQADNWGRICLLERLLKKRSLEKEYCATFIERRSMFTMEKSQGHDQSWSLQSVFDSCREHLCLCWSCLRAVRAGAPIYLRARKLQRHELRSQNGRQRGFCGSEWHQKLFLCNSLNRPSPTLACSNLVCNVNSSRCLLQRIATIREDLERKRRKSKS